jgi:hypothetical protein
MREVQVRFDADNLTTHGGYMLLESFFREIDLRKTLARHIRQAKRSNGFTCPEMASYLIDSKLLGYRRVYHVEVLRRDPLLEESYGIEGLPSDKTVREYLKSYGEHENENLSRCSQYLVDSLVRRTVRLSRRGGRLGVTVDFDSSTMTVYGKQEGADRGRSFRKKDKPGFQPKFAFIGEHGVMVNQRLYPQSYNLPSEFGDFQEETLGRLPRYCYVKGVRSDGALYSEERVEGFEKRKWRYGITATRTGDLRGRILQIPEDAWVEGVDEKGRPYSITEITYRPKTWAKARRYIVSRRLKPDAEKQAYLWPGEDYKYFAYVTNHKGKLYEAFKWCMARCTVENAIKEGKIGFDMDALPCGEFEANQAYLTHVQIAYNLSLFFKMLSLPEGAQGWTIETVRRRLLIIPGILRRSKEGLVLHLPRWWPYAQLFKRAKGRWRKAS